MPHDSLFLGCSSSVHHIGNLHTISLREQVTGSGPDQVALVEELAESISFSWCQQ